ncbi:MAG: trimethylamine methyltransferase family protein, partial [Anaerolineales bacterium]
MQVEKTNYLVNRTPTFEVLTEEEIRAIYFSALSVLSETGVRVYNKTGYDLLGEHGATIEDVEEGSALVKLQPEMVDIALSTLPRKVVIYGADHKKYKMELFKDQIYFGAGSDT